MKRAAIAIPTGHEQVKLRPEPTRHPVTICQRLVEFALVVHAVPSQVEVRVAPASRFGFTLSGQFIALWRREAISQSRNGISPVRNGRKRAAASHDIWHAGSTLGVPVVFKSLRN